MTEFQDCYGGGAMERLEIIETLKHMPDLLEAEIAGLPESTLRFRPAESEFSIKEVAGHMRDASEAWHKRLYQVWAQNDPLFTSFDGEAMVKERGYQDGDPQTVIAAIRAIRGPTVDLLAHAVDWTRLGQQRGVGRRTLKQFAEYLVSHDAEHLRQIQELKALAAQDVATQA
jgi:hypothetical protein